MRTGRIWERNERLISSQFEEPDGGRRNDEFGPLQASALAERQTREVRSIASRRRRRMIEPTQGVRTRMKEADPAQQRNAIMMSTKAHDDMSTRPK